MSDTVVYVVDDDAAVREALDSLLRSVGHGVETFASVAAFEAAERRDAPGCIVLDVRLPGLSGLEYQRARTDALPIVFITGHGDVPMSVAAMKAGAVEFLTKPFREQDVIDAVHRGLAADRERRARAARLAALGSRHATLTARERQVMAMVADGLANKEIAARLGLSEVTVKVHRGQVMAKMAARGVPDLVRMSDALAGADPAAPPAGLDVPIPPDN